MKQKMQIFNHIQELPVGLSFGLTIGNFDGVHLGHKYLLEQVKESCKEKSLVTAVMTFNPHPLVVLKGKKSFLLSDYDERARALNDFGVEYLIEVPFDRNFSSLEPGSFLDQYVFANNNVKALYLGYDFSFGADKKGNHDFVKKYCETKEVSIQVLGEHCVGERKYSSSQIRNLLVSGEVSSIKNILGNNYSFKGLVKRGYGRGAQLGYPTANLKVSDIKQMPRNGVYATETWYEGKKYKSVTNIGKNPTFIKNSDEVYIETYLLNFDKDIYGEEVKLVLIDRIRDEKKFESREQLIEQIGKDVETRRSLND